MKGLSKRQKIRYIVAELKNQRTTYQPQWQDIADFMLPYRLRLNIADQARGDRRNTRIYDSTATIAVRTFESGAMSAATDPAGQWVKLTTRDPERAEFGPHKEWLDQATQLLFSVFDGSNTYISLPTLYGNMAGFGTSCMSIEEDFEGDTIQTRVYPTGSYWIGQDYKGRVNVFYREFRMTVRQVYEQFGDGGEFSPFLQGMIDQSKWEQWIDIAHIIQPNDEYEPGKVGRKGKRYSSCWFELGVSGTSSGDNGYSLADDEYYLRESGFDDFPILCGRWEVTEGDIYAVDCPGMMALGDTKSLQVGERRGWQAIEKMVNPHVIAPSALKNQDPGFLPGGTSWLDTQNEAKLPRALYEINPRIAELSQKLVDVRQRIYAAFYYDLFRLFDTLGDKRQMTATEIIERKGEKLIQLVPMYGNLTRGVLRPLVDRTFAIMAKQGILPPAPPDLQGHPLELEYQGILAQAQRAVRAQPIERLFATVAPYMQARPDLMDKLNTDQAVDELGTAYGVPATVINSDEETAQIRAERAKAQQAAQMAQTVPALAKGAKDLSQADLESDNALTRLVGA